MNTFYYLDIGVFWKEREKTFFAKKVFSQKNLVKKQTKKSRFGRNGLFCCWVNYCSVFLPSLSSAFQSIPDIKIEEKRPATMPTIRGSAKF